MNNNTYIELLKQYQTGTISEADRHVLERAALDDPFLFDAMEGYGVYGTSVDTQAINTLKKSNTNKPGKVRWLNMRNLTVAASLVALLSITFLVKNQLPESDTNTVAVATEDTAKNTEPIAQTSTKDIGNGVSSKTEDSIEQVVEEIEMDEAEMDDDDDDVDFVAVTIGDINATATNEDVLPESNSPSPPPQTATQENNVENALTDAIAEEMDKKLAPLEATESYTEVVTTNTAKDEIVKKERASRPEKDKNAYDLSDGKGEFLLGEVLDIDGNNLIGANVYIENTEIGAVTDIDGNFKLPKYGNGHQIVVNYIGYKSQKIIIGDLDFYRIVMPRSNEPLSEVVVGRPKEVNKNKAFPAMGMEDFELYVSKNKKYPLEVFGTTKSGTFEVSFNVNTDGSLSNFVDESENCDDCFKEAVKLLKGSGKWETKPVGQLYRTSYLFEF